MDVGAFELLDIGDAIGDPAAELEINRALPAPAPALQRPWRQAPTPRQLFLIEKLIRHWLLRVANCFDPELITSRSCIPWALEGDAEWDQGGMGWG